MKKAMRKSVSVLLSALMLLSVPMCMQVYAADEAPVYLYVENEVQDGGLVNYRYVDENGNEVSAETDELACQSVDNLPSAYSAVSKGHVTSPKFQGYSGACWAFSAISLLESDSIVKGYKTLANADFSESHLSWFTGRGLTDNTEDMAYGDGYFFDDPYNQGGNWRISAATLARWSGAANESDFPFNGYNLDAMGNYAESDRYNTSGGVILESAQELTSVTDVKQWIIDHGSVTAAFYYDNNCYNSSTAAHCGSQTDVINHQIVVVGWDDSFPASDFKENCIPSGDGAWLCKNSWGTNWGDGGYFWLSYYDTSVCLFAGYTVQESTYYYRNYTYNGTDWHNAYGMSCATQAANVFTSGGYESLTAVAVQTVYGNTNISVTVYKNLSESYTTPVQGTAAASVETMLENGGYHTIYLDSAVALEPGEIFSVVVEYYTPDSEYTYVPVELTPADGQSYASREGESFVNLNASRKNWQSATNFGVYNVYVQAFTKCNHQFAIQSQNATCTVSGSEKIYCSQCGFVESERTVPATGHEYGEWSKFAYSAGEGMRISTSTCKHCDAYLKRVSYPGSVITIDTLMEMLLVKFKAIIRNIFTL